MECIKRKVWTPENWVTEKVHRWIMVYPFGSGSVTLGGYGCDGILGVLLQM